MATNSPGDNVTKSISLPTDLWEAVEKDLENYPDLTLSKLIQILLREKLDRDEVTVSRRRPKPIRAGANSKPVSDAAKVVARAERKMGSSSK